MRLLALVLFLAGCAPNEASGPSSFNVRMNGSYTAVGGAVLSR